MYNSCELALNCQALRVMMTPPERQEHARATEEGVTFGLHWGDKTGVNLLPRGTPSLLQASPDSLSSSCHAGLAHHQPWLQQSHCKIMGHVCSRTDKSRLK